MTPLNPIDQLKKELPGLKLTEYLRPKKARLSLKQLKKLAQEVRETFSDEDINRLRPS